MRYIIIEENLYMRISTATNKHWNIFIREGFSTTIPRITMLTLVFQSIKAGQY